MTPNDNFKEGNKGSRSCDEEAGMQLSQVSLWLWFGIPTGESQRLRVSQAEDNGRHPIDSIHHRQLSWEEEDPVDPHNSGQWESEQNIDPKVGKVAIGGERVGGR